MAREKVNFANPSGFPEYLPGEKRRELAIIDSLRDVFQRYGYAPIETPAVERLEVLQAKGTQGDNIIYGIQPILPRDQADAQGDSGKESRGLKFDQTVPLAAFIARHYNDLTFPFARYQIDTVFRGERAKEGRYRQFRQADIDVVGRGSLSLMYDAQVAAIIAEVFQVMAIGPFRIRINNRRILTGLFESFDVPADGIRACMAALDALEAAGESTVREKLGALGVTAHNVDELMRFASIAGDDDELFRRLDEVQAGETYLQGVSELREVMRGVRDLGVSEDLCAIDLSIARGLNYYTGTVYETTLLGHEHLGSICSGGRYDDLVSTFVGEQLPGVGISIGLTRLLVRLFKEGILEPLESTPSQIAVLNLSEELMATYLRVSQELRRAGFNVETSFGAQKLKRQMNTVNQRGIPLCLLIGEDEAAAGTCQVKDMRSGEQVTVGMGELVESVGRLLK